MQNIFELEVWGPLGLFPIPGTNAGLASYPVMTPSAANGLLKSIHWKPAIDFKIHDIFVCSMPEYQSIMVNEINFKPTYNGKSISIEDQKCRTQNAKTYLVNPHFIIRAEMHLTDKMEAMARDLADSNGNLDAVLAKHIAIFNRRVLEMTPHRQPVLGTSECVARFKFATPLSIRKRAIKKDIWVGQIPVKTLYNEDGGIVGCEWKDFGVVKNGHLKVSE